MLCKLAIVWIEVEELVTGLSESCAVSSVASEKVVDCIVMSSVTEMSHGQSSLKERKST